MARFFKDRSNTMGKIPGEFVHVGRTNPFDVNVRVIDYRLDHLYEESGYPVIENNEYIESENNSWINIDCLHDMELMNKIVKNYDLHPLVMADILNTGLRPKIDELENGLFIVMKMLRFDEDEQQLISEQFSMIVRNNHLITFQERPGDVFEPVRDRIRKKKGRIVTEKIDYLAYSLMDAIVDNYIFIVEKMGTEIENIEEELLVKPTLGTVENITRLKRELIYLRKSIRPAKEVIQYLNKCENEIIRDSTMPFLNDLLNNVTQVTEIIDTYKEMLTEHMNSYNSIMSNRLNDIMKVLTIFSVIFIPLTFIAGIYGTNFDYIPELRFEYGYFMLWLILIIVAGSMIAFFKKKKWF